MYLLIKLARFITSEEQKEILKEIEKYFKSVSKSVQIRNDDWISKNRLLIKFDLLNKNIDEITQELFRKVGITSIIAIPPTLFNFDSESLGFLIHLLTDYMKKNGFTDFSLDLLNIGKVPLHKKAIIDRLQKRNYKYNLNSKFQIYMEIRSNHRHKETRNIQVRIGRKYKPAIYSYKDRMFIPKLILYSPFTVQEVADFLRLSLTFNLTVIMSNENDLVEKLINKVKKTYFKGINKINYEITPSVNEFLINSKQRSVGFSLWGTKPIDDLSELIRDIISKNTDKPVINFIFGNEEVGLPLSVRKKIPMFRIGFEASEPLRASQAAAYTLGTLLFQ